MRFLPFILLLGLSSCFFDPKPTGPLKVDGAFIQVIDAKNKSSDNRIVICFNQKITSYIYGFADKSRFKYKVKVRISSRKGWTQDIHKGLLKVRVLEDPKCLRLSNESFYHPAMGFDEVVNENFSKENITYISVKLLKFKQDSDTYQKIDHFIWKGDN
jgi:hypothetical protein